MRLDDMPVTHTFVPGAPAPNGDPTSLHVVTAGPKDGTPVLLLHGFPECWYSWRHQITALADAGYHVIAPDLRGYNQSSRPKSRRAYRVDALVADLREMLANMSVRACHLVGHDWGAAIAWELAASHPALIRTLTIANCPRAHILLGMLTRSFAQAKRSWYMLAFQPPFVGEALLKRTGPKRLFQGTSAKGTFTNEDIAVYAKAWSEPGALTAMLNYYRANAIVRAQSWKERIAVPTLLLWGMNDAALGPELIPPTLAECDDARLVELPGVSHWSPAEAAPRVNEELLAHLAAHGGPDRLIYKIVPTQLWSEAPDPWPGSADDLRDGFVHLSSRTQVRGTLAAHFKGAGDVVILGVDPLHLPPKALRWEESRSGKRFPHLYAPLPHAAVVTRFTASETADGYALPADWTS